MSAWIVTPAEARQEDADDLQLLAVVVLAVLLVFRVGLFVGRRS